MRRFALLVLLVAACTNSTTTTITIDPLPPPPNPEGPRTTLPPVTVPREAPSTPPIQGYLPDGTDYIVKLRASEPEEVRQINASIVLEEGGALWWIAAVQFLPGDLAESPSGQAGLVREQVTPEWYVEIEFHRGLIEEAGLDADRIIESMIEFTKHEGFLGLDLVPPLRWSTHYDPTGPMEVRYGSFLVTTGCDDDAIACLPNETMQAKDLTGGRATPDLTIESFIGRPISDPSYLDPGPLSRRIGADVLWTGEEMIVWGGRKNDRVWHQDGAAYNPETDTWRVLSEAPMSDDRGSYPVWIGEEMVVISPEGTFGYDPSPNTWREIAGPAAGSGSDPAVIAIDGTVYVWATPDLLRLASGASEWEKLPRPEWTWYRSFRDYDGRLLVTSASNEVCTGRRFQAWEGEVWEELRGLTFGTEGDDCSDVDQVGVLDGRIVAWGFSTLLAKIYDDAAGEWIDIGGPPFSGTEGSGPVVIGDRLLVTGRESGAIYDAATMEWTAVDLPGAVGDINLVWTGSEILAWVDGREAWRWAPPE